MISIQQMHYILVLSEELHFQRASERCFVTQPTLSMQIKKAEETLEAQIFDRSRNPLKLTPFGRDLLPIIRDTLSEYEGIETLHDKRKGLYKEEVKMAVIPTIAGYLLPDLYTEWKKELNDIQLSIEELKTEEIIKAFDQKRIDVAILAGPVHDPRLRTIPLFQEEIKVFYPKGKKKSMNNEDLRTLNPWLLTSGNCLRTQMVNFCELREDSHDDWDYEGGNIELLQRMVQLHGGYTLVPSNYIREDSASYKRLESSSGEVPAREVIALAPNRTGKWKSIERLIRSVQLRYNQTNTEAFQILNWE